MNQVRVSGTLIWYYHICLRQVWLISHQLTPDAEDQNILIGRLIDETSYGREKKELIVGSSKIDVYRFSDEHLLIGEVKKSSRYRESARMQLAFYLKELAAYGVEAEGELRFPTEKTKEKVTLDKDTIAAVARAEREILQIIELEKPPPPEKNRFCRKCAYAEFCWS